MENKGDFMIGIKRITGITGMLEYDYFRQYLNEISPYNTGIDNPHNFTQEEAIEALKAIAKLIKTIIDIMEKDKGEQNVKRES